MRKIIGFLAFFWLLTGEVTSQQLSSENLRQEGFYRVEFIDIQDIFPNPASSIAILNYSFRDPMKEATVIIHDLLGSLTRSYPLNPYEKTIKIDLHDFKEGVYFYSIQVEGENKVTKKLIIKK